MTPPKTIFLFFIQMNVLYCSYGGKKHWSNVGECYSYHLNQHLNTATGYQLRTCCLLKKYAACRTVRRNASREVLGVLITLSECRLRFPHSVATVVPGGGVFIEVVSRSRKSRWRALVNTVMNLRVP